MSFANRTNQTSSSHQRGPRQGRADSQSGFNFSYPQQSQDRGQSPQIPQSPIYIHRPTPTVNRAPNLPPTDLQRWSSEQLTVFLRWAYTVRDRHGHAHPNYNYDPDINVAINVSETIDAFDENPGMASELILRIANPDLGHASMDWIIQNRSLVEILLYRHWQRRGRPCSSPRAEAMDAVYAHEKAHTTALRNNPNIHENYLPRIRFPGWKAMFGAKRQ